jgi:ABC-type dipeptide/oligopeptide/nickel transport system permease subunit
MYYLHKKDSTTQMTASIVLSLIQLFLLLDIFVIVRIIYEYPIPENFNKFWALPLIIVVFTFNWLKYVKNKDRLETKKLLRIKWENEELTIKKKRGFLVLTLIMIVISMPIIYGIVRHNIMGGKSFWG